MQPQALPLPPGEDPNKLTSVEAAALMLSGGKTKDPQLASYMAETQEFDRDGLIQSHLARMMGFPFKINVTSNKIHVYAKDGSKMSTHCKLKPGDLNELMELTNEQAIDRLVDACLRLKQKHEKAEVTA